MIDLTSSILTPAIIEIIQKRVTSDANPFLLPHLEEKQEKQKAAVAAFLANLLTAACRHYVNNRPLKFNANPGDHGCQKRAIQIFKLMRHGHLYAYLNYEARELHNLVKDWEQEKVDFFNKGIQVSEKILFLVRCHLLEVTKKVDHIDSVGFECTVLDFNKIGVLSKRFNECFSSDLRAELLAVNASRLAEESLRVIQWEAINPLTNPLTQELLSAKHIRWVQPLDTRFPPKPFGCLFFEMQMFFKMLKKEMAIIAFKKIEKEAPCSYYFYEMSEHGFSPISTNQITDRYAPIIVFLGAISIWAQFIETVKTVGIEKMILLLAAQEPPYDRATSTLEDVKNEEARALIKQYREEAKLYGLDIKDNPVFQMRHVFCSTLEEEGL